MNRLLENSPLIFDLSLEKDGAAKKIWNSDLGFWNLRLRRNQIDAEIEEFGAL